MIKLENPATGSSIRTVSCKVNIVLPKGESLSVTNEIGEELLNRFGFLTKVEEDVVVEEVKKPKKKSKNK